MAPVAAFPASFQPPNATTTTGSTRSRRSRLTELGESGMALTVAVGSPMQRRSTSWEFAHGGGRGDYSPEMPGGQRTVPTPSDLGATLSPVDLRATLS